MLKQRPSNDYRRKIWNDLKDIIEFMELSSHFLHRESGLDQDDITWHLSSNKIPSNDFILSLVRIEPIRFIYEPMEIERKLKNKDQDR